MGRMLKQCLAANATPRRMKPSMSGFAALAGLSHCASDRLRPRVRSVSFSWAVAPATACVTALVIITILLTLSALPAHAENLGPGGGTRIITGDEVVGPYRLLITAAPEPAQVGTLTIVVRVNDASTGLRVDDAAIRVELTHGASSTRLTEVATHANAGNKIDYAAHFVIDQPGPWNGQVRVAGAAGTAEVTFVLRVQAQRQVGVLIAAGIPFIVILGVLAGVWLARSGRKPHQNA